MTPKQEHYNWIQNIIDSCNNTFHFEGVDNLIALFDKYYNDADLLVCLKQMRNEHFNNVHNILT